MPQRKDPPDQPRKSRYTKADYEALEAAERADKSRRCSLARSDPAAFAEYVLRDEETGGEIELAEFHKEWHKTLDEHRLAVIWAPPETGKAVPLDTPIPTPIGWRTMAEISVGDEVFGSDGLPHVVVGVSETQRDRQLFRVTFDDGGSCVADADHQWIASTKSAFEKDPPAAAHAGDGPFCACGCGLRVTRVKGRGREWHTYVVGHHGRRPQWGVVTTREMLASGLMRKADAWRKDGSPYDRRTWRIPIAAAVGYPGSDLPVPPYVLGVWLGDGDSVGPTVTCHEDDAEILSRCIELEGGRCGKLRRDHRGKGKTLRQVVGGDVHSSRDPSCLHARLRELGVMSGVSGVSAKHIPSVYLNSSIEQRRDLLAGLLDTDGTVSGKGTGAVEFSVTRERLARDTLELVRSLGFKASMTEGDAKLNGRIVSRRWRLHFSPRIPVFRLKRKLARQKLGDPFGRCRYRCIKSIEPVESVPVKCISVDSPDSSYLMGRDYTVTHNTQSVSVARVLYKLGKNPASRILVLSKSYAQAVKIVRSVKRYIETSQALREVADGKTFHLLQPGAPWTDGAFTVKRREGQGDPKDPSVQAVGVNGSFLGARVDHVVGDDMLDFENTYTARARVKAWEWFMSMVTNRLSRNGTAAMIANCWHPDDLMHRLVSLAGWFGQKFPIINDSGESLWPERWPLGRIEQRRQELSATPEVWARQYLLNAIGDRNAPIRVEDFEEALRLGNGITPIKELEGYLPEGYRSYTAVDIGSARMTSAGKSAIFSILVNPQGVKLILECQSGKWKGGELADRVVDAHQRYQSLVVVESNAVQDLIADLIGDRCQDMKVRAFMTGMNRHHAAFGIDSFGVELARGLWIIPNMGGRMVRELAEWRSELLSYDPEAHPGDRLMASYIAREAARMDMRSARPARVSVRFLGGPQPPSTAPLSEFVPDEPSEPILLPVRW